MGDQNEISKEKKSALHWMKRLFDELRIYPKKPIVLFHSLSIIYSGIIYIDVILFVLQTHQKHRNFFYCLPFSTYLWCIDLHWGQHLAFPAVLWYGRA